MNGQRKSLLGVPVDLWPPDEVISRMEESIHSPIPQTLFAVNPEKIMLSRKDQDLSLALKQADFLIPDGIGVIIGLKLIYGKRMARAGRIAGVALMTSLLDSANRMKKKIFVFGASPEVNESVARIIPRQYPDLVLAGHRHGFMAEYPDEDLVQEINSLSVDILFVGLGSPKQEKWIQKNRNRLKVRICMGVGGSFDVLAGKISRAPRWMQKAGLEWLYRLVREPGRIRRQLALPRFAWALIKEKMAKKHF